MNLCIRSGLWNPGPSEDQPNDSNINNANGDNESNDSTDSSTVYGEDSELLKESVNKNNDAEKDNVQVSSNQ